ncbi:zinc-binding metallopeptidase family protein [Arcobacter porcinus]|uniref:M42 glutamyl aminopeptidase n=1 Tax=Arcobacter porcinus TaxID=1935204 RepID=A0ABX2YEW4_9BACT|nr:peptidase M42 [Arcobacter porcinus]OCL82894.1 M42 glutamyl aminopeptidase [Arcobacter porcinus]OCL84477.1 M42 glutamyl aminopeptidase [Arcobacter porcinus]OCL89018.1 M42 glutamyl aminopeptidase [Arcobacter porcinus]OCL93540.1 M42 glutamyl aminopeptidase [Arcobacter porcinus]
MNASFLNEQKNFSIFLDLLKQLIRVPSVTGAEHSFLLYLKRELDELGIKTEHYDGLLVAIGNEPINGILSAHIDRHGIICTGPNEFQFAAFLAKNRSDLRGNSLSEQTFQLISKRYINQDVHAYDPFNGGYLGMGKIKDAFLKEEINNLIFEIEGLNHLVPSTPIAFVDKLKQEENLISAQLDNVISAAIILYLYQNGFQGTAFFTAQEEAGKSWRFINEWFKKNKLSTNRLIVLDTSPFDTREEANNQQIVLRNKDANAKFKSPLLKEIKSFCKKNKISFSCKDNFLKEKNILRVKNGLKPLSIGSTELGRIILESNGSIQGTTLQIPTTGYHTVDETANILSVKSVIFILSSFYIKNFSKQF